MQLRTTKRIDTCRRYVAAVLRKPCVVCILLLTPGSLFADFIWINKDFKNTTNGIPNDLEWEIAGDITGAIVDTFTGAPFSGSPKITVPMAIPPSPPITEVTWSGGDIGNGETVHVGLKLDKDKLPGPRGTFSFQSSAHWSFPNTTDKVRVAGCAIDELIGDPAVFVFAPLDPGEPALDVFDFAYAIVKDPFALSSLTFNNPAIPFVHIPGFATIAPGGQGAVASIPAQPGDFVVWEMAVKFSGDPLGNAGHVIMQEQTPIPEPSTFLLSIMAVMLISTQNRRAVGLFKRRRTNCRLAKGRRNIN